MFQKEVAERILANANSKEYSRITILSKWKFDIRKITDVKPNSFFPKPKIDSTVLEFIPKTKIHEIKDPKNLEKITKVFFSQRRKMINKPFSKIFKNYKDIAKLLKIDLNKRPADLSSNDFFRITEKYEKQIN